ncbi:MAG TPA: HAMP domain-containing sensor histidine kinase [Actinomycetota bacterium]|nr:HAMP domain-containing sensor histidine kinase [Actinomycetota bacterium]
MPRRRWGVRARLARTLGITAALSVAGTALITFYLVRQYAEQQALDQLSRQGAAAAADTVSLESSGKAPEPALTAALKTLLTGSGDRVVYVTPAGQILGQDTIAIAVARAINLTPAVGGRTVQGTVQVPQGDYVYVAEPVPGRRARGAVSAVVLARPVGLAATVWKPVIGRVLLAGALAVLVAIAASLWVARRLADPLRRVSEATRKVGAGDLTQRVPVEGAGELAELAQQFNAMSEALSEARRREHEFLANVSHELRTPITAIRGYAEALADGTARGAAGEAEAVRVIGDEAARLELLVRDVIDLARLGAHEFSLDRRAASLGPTLDEAVATHAARAAAAGVVLRAGADLGGVTVVTDPLRVRQIASNLIDNALRVTPAGGSISLTARATPDEVIVEVADTGPGIAPGDLPHVFERSYLWAKAQSHQPVGTGLGLAIVRDLAVALGGRVEVASVVGSGTTFSLHLPRSATGTESPRGPATAAPPASP